MQIRPSTIVDALVLGAGPGGSTAALHLERLGVPTLVLEARAPLATRPNVIDLSPEAVDALRDVGAAGILDGRMGVGRRSGGAAIALRALELHERDLLTQHGTPIEYGARIIAHEPGGGTGGTDLVRLADGRSISARRIINATGGRSGIEDALGMGLRFRGDWTWVASARVPHLPDLPTGERITDRFAARLESVDRGGELYPKIVVEPTAPELERWRGTQWYGWQNPTDGLSMFQPVGSGDLQRLQPAELAERLLAPALHRGVRRDQVLDAPRLIRIESASVERARVGSVLAIGDAAGRAHAQHMVGTQLALTDARRAAHAVASSLDPAQPTRAEHVLRAYDEQTRAAHAAVGAFDGTRVLAADPLRGLGRDVVELDGRAAWPAPPVST